MLRSEITEVAVRFPDGHIETWEGKGHLNVTRTPAGAGEHPVEKDTDISFVTATLRFARQTENEPGESDG